MAAAVRILVVEDDPGARRLLVDLLEDEGIEVHAVADGHDAVDAAATARPHLVILDVGLPGQLDGLALARHFREQAEVAILFVSGYDRVDQRVAGLDAGGDDYVTKPFEPAELVARVRALLRRTGHGGGQVWKVADLVVDEDAHRVTRADHVIDLTPIEFGLLCRLLRNHGRVVTQSVADVWGHGQAGRNALQVHMGALRRKLETHGAPLIHTVRATGYKLDP